NQGLQPARLEERYIVAAAKLHRHFEIGKLLPGFVENDDIGGAEGPRVEEYLLTLDGDIGDRRVAHHHSARIPRHGNDLRLIGEDDERLSGPSLARVRGEAQHKKE